DSSKAAFTYTNSANWTQAQTFCRQNHTDLLSGAEQLHLRNTSGDCWIGLFRDTWGWSDGSESSVRAWDQWDQVLLNNPDKNEKRCVTLRADGKMQMEYCNKNKHFICYDELLVLVKENKTFEEALHHCRRHYLDLAWFTDRDHLKKMTHQRAKMADSDAVWVGLHYSCFLEAWIWVNGHYVSDKNENWKVHGESECGEDGAVERGDDHQWVKRKSWEKLNFICVR
ncbi:hypothetical protein NQD34_013923, partial [Periophthalmus magnuspinnatus]